MDGAARTRRPRRRPVAVVAPERLEGRALLASLGAANAGGPAAVAAFAPSYLPSAGAPGTPAFTTYYDLANLPGGISTPDHPAYPWLSSFDPTTQTLWMDLRGPEMAPPDSYGGGDSVIQLDPATGMARTFDLRRFEPNPSITNGEPHGIFFDFETHLTPRIWFTQRQAGLLNFIDPSDPAHNQLITYDYGAILRAAGIKDVNAHAVSVDPAGNVWIGDVTSKVIVEFDFHHLPDGQSTGSLSSLVGTMIVHPEPPSIQSQGGVTPEFVGPHGISILIDQQTGQEYVYFTNFGNGRISVLLPNAGPNGQDIWVSYDVSKALGYKPNASLALFPSVDTAETPGVPRDDSVYFADAGFDQINAGGPTDYSLSNDVIRQLIPGAISSTGEAGPAIVRSWQIPSAVPSPDYPLGAPEQTFVDREGNVFYTDRRTGFGRLDPNVFDAARAGAPGATISVTPDVIVQPVGSTSLIQPSRVYDFGAVPEVQLTTTSVVSPDVSNSPGLDQYLLDDIKAPGNPAVGPLRSAISTNNVIFSSLTNADDLMAASIFAETDRRPMALAVGPGDARQAFQVLRDGHVIATYRASGELLDHQLDLTAASGGPAIVGDVSAVTDPSGLVHLFGRDAIGLAEYVFNPATSQVMAESRAASPPGAGLLDSTPTALDYGPDGQPAALVTTSSGHLLLYTADSGRFLDLTAQAGGEPTGLVYSSVGAVAIAGTLYAYGSDQQGDLIEYQVPEAGGLATSRKVDLPGGRDTRVFQDVEAIAMDGVREVFATDGAGRVVHVAIGAAGDFSENVTDLALATARGYSPYQAPYAGRVNPDLAPAVDPTTGTLYVYGVNGRDLVEFSLPADGSGWRVTDLTNALPANRVFGGPVAYITAQGDRHVLMINQDGEVIEYAKLQGLAFSTRNITLALGDTASPAQFPTTATPTPVTAPATATVVGLAVPHPATRPASHAPVVRPKAARPFRATPHEIRHATPSKPRKSTHRTSSKPAR